MTTGCRFEPVPWEQIPDLGLYMDQVITFIGRIYAPVYGQDEKRCLSPSMINNYVKARLLPRPAGKKYSREQIALLTMIVALKQTLSIEEIRSLLAREEAQGVEALYADFCQLFSRVIDSIQREDGSALDYAILSSGYQAGCARMLRDPEDTQQ